jgi:hypothetical protein
MPTPVAHGFVRGRVSVPRALAILALLIATSVVLWVVLEATEPGRATTSPHIRPLPRNFIDP